MFAVINDRGRQAGVREGEVILCDQNRDWNEGDEVTFDQVLLISNEGEVQLGTPALEGASVTGEVLGHVKGKKEVIFRFKRRKNVRVKQGHRQKYARVAIETIEG